jgi:hypothetical protein
MKTKRARLELPALVWLTPLLVGAACSNSGSSNTGASGGSGGTTMSTGGNGSGGLVGMGGTAGGGGATGTGGSLGAGGTTGSGGSTGDSGIGDSGIGDSGIAVGSGGQGPSGGRGGSGGAGRSGGAGGGASTGSGGGVAGSSGTGSGGSNRLDAGAGGRTGSGGTSGTGGSAASGGISGTGGTAGSSGTTGPGGPCDIYQSANTPCVAAHSTVRALYGSYGGRLYQVRRASDATTKDIPVLDPGGYADSSVQDTFCAGTTCTISVIYDQSPNANDLTKSPPGGWLHNGGLEANAAAAKIKVNGHTVYGVYTTMNWDDDVGAVGYRNNKTKGVPTGDQPEAMYMVVSGKHYNQWCCFDYGNAETNNLDNGKATMECVYFGSSTQWAKGNGAGPWVLADLEDGVFHGGDPNAVTATNTPISATYVTAMLKGPSGNRFALKGGDAQSGTLAVKYDGARPPGYSPQKKEGAIILGTGGDNSHTGEGTFFEGCMTSGNPSDATDDAVQANIVAAGYGR